MSPFWRIPGSTGGSVARSASGLSLYWTRGMEVALVPPVLDAPRDVTVASVDLRAVIPRPSSFSTSARRPRGGCARGLPLPGSKGRRGRRPPCAREPGASQDGRVGRLSMRSAGFSGPRSSARRGAPRSVAARMLRRADGAEVVRPPRRRVLSQVDEEARPASTMKCDPGFEALKPF